MKILVTGASGFTGRYMMEYLAACHMGPVTGLVRRSIPAEFLANPKISWVSADLLNTKSLIPAVRYASPDAIIHLAGLTHGTRNDLFISNVLGTKNLMNAICTVNPDCRVLVISSSAVYGFTGMGDIPESSPLNPISDYGQSKQAQENLVLNFTGDGKPAVTVARLFNLAGPGQPDAFVCGRIVRQIAECERGERQSLDLRETRSARDFIDVRDVVRAYYSLIVEPDFLNKCTGTVFNIGSGIATTVSEVISIIESITGRHYPIKLPFQEPSMPIPSQRGNISRIATITGWSPQIPLDQTLSDMLDAASGKKKVPGFWKFSTDCF